jgi:uncharacterized protein
LRLPFAALAICLIAAASGCSVLAPQPDTSRFFVLTPLAATDHAAAPSPRVIRTLGLGPISFPSYLDRSEVVTRVTPNQVKISNTDFWAAPPEDMFTHVLSENLANLLGTEQILLYPWYRTFRPDYAVAVDVDRFESNGTTALLRARWTIRRTREDRLVYTGKAAISEPAASAEPEAQASALSRTLNELSEKIAASIRTLPEDRGKSDRS